MESSQVVPAISNGPTGMSSFQLCCLRSYGLSAPNPNSWCPLLCEFFWGKGEAGTEQTTSLLCQMSPWLDCDKRERSCCVTASTYLTPATLEHARGSTSLSLQFCTRRTSSITPTIGTLPQETTSKTISTTSVFLLHTCPHLLAATFLVQAYRWS